MNLSESAKYVLKNNSQSLISGFWKEDVRSIFSELKKDFRYFKIHTPKSKKGLIRNYRYFKDNTLDTFQLFSELPHRVKSGFTLFKYGFIHEMDNLADPKEKTVFCLKVIGALTSFAVGAMYDVKKSKQSLNIPGLSKRSAFAQFMVTEMVLRLSYLFILRFIGEIELQVEDQEDLKKLKFFKQMLAGGSERPPDWKDDPEDKAFQLVDSFKNYIMTGRES